MKTILSRTFFTRLGGLMLLSAMALFVAGCSDDDSDGSSGSISITGLQLPSTIDASPGDDVTLTGRGFKSGDKLVLQTSLSSSEKCTIPVKNVTGSSVSFVIPDDLSSGKYKCLLSRGERLRLLGTTTFNIQSKIPDKEGMNVKGMISSAGKPLAGVVVSDGYVVTKTDAQGLYYFNSAKKNGYVFISVPSGYDVPVVETTPQFFKYLTQPAATVEQRDFVLTARQNDKYKLIVFTDVHLANRVSDLSQYRSGFLAEASKYARETEAAGTPVYGVSLGDLAWDSYWYENKFTLTDYRLEARNLNFPVFNTPGNHDNDPIVANDDFKASAPWRTIMGPGYYSFNLGKVHYILIDNVVYTNPTPDGSHTYESMVASEIMAWLKEDLATVTKTTPVVLGMHVPMHRTPQSADDMTFSGLKNAAELVECFDGYTNVNILSGHTHVNYNVARSANLREHNISAVCATWWWTGHTNYAGNHISTDGSPGGYKIFDLDGTSMKWQFKGIGQAADYQFRTYDLNKCLVTAAKYCPGAKESDVKTYGGGYDVANNKNEVLINVFDWAADWTIEVKDLSTNEVLTPTRVRQQDPLHIISYNMKKLANNSTAMTFPTTNTAHLFKVTAKSATSTVKVTVTDGFGRVYTQEMTRPKELTVGSK